jgi:hypothetical protein
MRRREDEMTTVGGRGPVTAMLVAGSVAVASLAGCGSGTRSVTVSPQARSGTTGPVCLRDATGTVCVTPGGEPPGGHGTATADGTPTKEPATAAWGGGSRVGTFTTRGTVTGDVGDGRRSRTVSGTCDVASDVRTVAAEVSGLGRIVVDVTGSSVASVTVQEVGGPTRVAEYLGEDEVLAVVTLTPTTTRVRGALLVPPTGSDAPAMRVDATFDC